MYLITKPKGDARITTCGLIIPDNHYVVMEMNFNNMKQIEQLRKFGYLVEETTLAEGTYTPDGRRVDKYSLRDFYHDGGKLIFLDDGPDVQPEREEPVVVKDQVKDDIALLRAKLDAKGIKYRKDAKAEALAKKLAS